MVDRYTKIAMTVIAVGMWTQIALTVNPVSDAKADVADRIIERVLFCIDSSNITGHVSDYGSVDLTLYTYCSR